MTSRCGRRAPPSVSRVAFHRNDLCVPSPLDEAPTRGPAATRRRGCVARSPRHSRRGAAPRRSIPRSSRPSASARDRPKNVSASRLNSDDPPVGVHDDDDAAGQFDQRAVAVLAGAQRLLGAHARRDVDGDAADERRAAVLLDQELQRRPPLLGAVVAKARTGSARSAGATSAPCDRCPGSARRFLQATGRSRSGRAACRRDGRTGPPTRGCRTRSGRRCSS